MSSLLDAANAEPNKIEVTDKLPERIGDVSIMTLEQVFKALENSHSNNSRHEHYDSNNGYESSKYHVYGLKGRNGTDSTAENLQAVGLEWYKQLMKPATKTHTWLQAGHKVFGGPLDSVWYFNCSSCDFVWYYNIYDDFFYDGDCYDCSDKTCYWDGNVNSSIYVAVVRAHE